MKKFKMHSSCHPSQIPAIGYALPRSHSRGFNVGHKFNMV